MPVHFHNPGLLDRELLTIMGASIKTEGSIGYFGTGLKYAIATLLRTGHQIEIRIGADTLKPVLRDVTLRGQAFQRVYLSDGTALPFTTELGKNWEVWMAYRELYSNALDEKGGVVSSGSTKVILPETEGDEMTVITVTGPDIERVHSEDRKDIFLDDDYIFEVSTSYGKVQVYDRPSKYVYYRGIRAGTLDRPSMLTYSLDTANLSEDREIKDRFSMSYAIGKAVAQISDLNLCRRVVRASKLHYEASIPLHGDGSDNFIMAAKSVAREEATADNIKSFAKAHTPKGEWVRTVKSLAPHESRRVDDAMKLVQRLLPAANRDELSFVEDIPGAWGMVENGEIFISLGCIRQGDLFLAGTIYEEFLHKHKGLADYSRGMFDYIIQDLMNCVAQLPEASAGAPARQHENLILNPDIPF